METMKSWQYAPNDVLENDVKLKQEMEIMPKIPWKQCNLGCMHQMTYWKMTYAETRNGNYVMNTM